MLRSCEAFRSIAQTWIRALYDDIEPSDRCEPLRTIGNRCIACDRARCREEGKEAVTIRRIPPL